MSPNRSNKKPEAGSSGLKVLITAASLVASLGGWAALTREPTQPTTTSVPATDSPTAVVQNQPSPAALALNQPPSTTLVLNLPPLPTLVSPPAGLAASAGHVVVANSSAPAVAASSNNPAPVDQTQPQLTLRVVNLPPPPPPPPSSGHHSQGSGPAPVATTKSSR